MAFRRCLTISALGAWTWAVLAFFLDDFFLDVVVEFLCAARRGAVPAAEVEAAWEESERLPSDSLLFSDSPSDVGWVFAEKKSMKNKI